MHVFDFERSLWVVVAVLQITPSYFDGYKPQAPPENTDDFNRRLFEEQLLDMLLVSPSQRGRLCV